MLKCNVDAAFSPLRNLGTMSAIIKDYQGRVIIGKARMIHTSSSLVAEAMAIRESLILTHSSFCNEVLLESDCSIVIEVCRRGNLKPEIATLVIDILGL